jgi:hypothetical protein
MSVQNYILVNESGDDGGCERSPVLAATMSKIEQTGGRVRLYEC